MQPWITWSGLYSSLLINQSSLWISERDTTSRLMASGRNLQQQLSLKLTEIALKPVSQPSPKPRNLRPAAVMSCHYTLLDAPNDRTQKTLHTKTETDASHSLPPRLHSLFLTVRSGFRNYNKHAFSFRSESLCCL